MLSVSESYDDDYDNDVEDEEMILKPKSKPILENNFELLAGCLKTDDSAKVDIGCSAEWLESPDKPLVKHCICVGHMCNYFYKISDDNMDKYKSLRILGEEGSDSRIPGAEGSDSLQDAGLTSGTEKTLRTRYMASVPLILLVIYRLIV